MDEKFGVKHPEHIPGEVIHEYFRQYADNFELKTRIELEVKVTVAEKVDKGWRLQLETASTKPEPEEEKSFTLSKRPVQRTITCAKLVVATGLTSSSQPIDINGSEDFRAPIVNFADYPSQAHMVHDDTRIKDVTVYGGGKSAHDIVYLMATHGKRVSWIIRASGYGPTYMAPAHIYIGPLRCCFEKLTTTRPLKWFSPCIWGDADGFRWVRNLLHGTTVGRWVVDMFWNKLGSDLAAQTHIAEHETTERLVPDQPAFWYGTDFSILNYPTDIYALVRTGQAKVIRKDVRCLGSQKTVNFEDGSSVRIDALVCCRGWKFTPTIDFRPKEIHAGLGIPSADLSKTQRETWDRLNTCADTEVFKAFPKLRDGAKMSKSSLVVHQEDMPYMNTTKSRKPGKEVSPWRLWRGIAPLSLSMRDIVFLGNVLLFQGAVRSEISSIWAYAYMYDKLTEPLASIAKASVPLRLNSGNIDCDHIQYDTALFNRFAGWRTPMGLGKRYPDVIFDGIPYFDLLLQDLGLNTWRKGWGWLGEIFGGSYGQADYRGLIDEWKILQRTKGRSLSLKVLI